MTTFGERLSVTYRSYQSSFNGKLYKSKFHKVGSGLKIAGKLRVGGHGLIEIGQSVTIGSYVIFSPFNKNAKIVIGDRVFLNDSVLIMAHAQVTIDDESMISSHVVIMDYDWHGIDSMPPVAEPVKIGHHVWIGLKAMILKGVTIGDFSIIGAGSVVATDVPPNSIFAGNPARFVRATKTGYTP